MVTNDGVDSLAAGSVSKALGVQSSPDAMVKWPEVEPGFVATIVIPAFNEEKGLPLVLERLYLSVDGQAEVLVVDDGSSDATTRVASGFRCGVIRHGQNRGKGEAMLTGTRYARGDSVIFIDADGTYPPEAIPQMIRAMESYDVVYCSRNTGREHIPRMNRLGNALFQGFMKYVYGFRASDYATGLYGIKKRLLLEMNVCSRGFAIEPEIAIKASRMQLKVLDIPIQYEERIGKAKLSGLKAGWQHLEVMGKLALWRPRQRAE